MSSVQVEFDGFRLPGLWCPAVLFRAWDFPWVWLKGFASFGTLRIRVLQVWEQVRRKPARLTPAIHVLGPFLGNRPEMELEMVSLLRLDPNVDPLNPKP